MSRVNEAFGAGLELYVLFAERTLRQLALRVAEAASAGAAEDAADVPRTQAW
jgi:hypothetical protein